MSDAQRSVTGLIFRVRPPLMPSGKPAVDRILEWVAAAKGGGTIAGVSSPGRSLVVAAAREAGVGVLLPDLDGVCRAPLWEPAVVPRAGRLEGRCVLVTGGYGGVGGVVAAEVCRLGGRVVLSDAREVTSLPVTEQIRLGLLARTGRVVLARPSEVSKTVGQRGWGIDTLVHCAGRLELARVADLGPDDVARWLSAKTQPLDVAVEQSRGLGLRRVVLCGSVESRAPHPGFGGYALANEALRCAGRALSEEFAVVTAEWSLWSEVGMGAFAAPQAASAGFAVVPPEWGAAVLAGLVDDEDAGRYLELALGGPGITPDRSCQVIAGVAGVCVDHPWACRRLARLLGCNAIDVDWSKLRRSDGTVRAIRVGDAVEPWDVPCLV